MATGLRSGGIGFFDRLRTGWTLTKDSFGVLRRYPVLAVFPLLAGISGLVFLIAFLVPLWLGNLIGSGVEFVVLLAFYFVTTFVSTYFACALVYASNEAFHDREPGVMDSLRAVSDRLGPIVVWSAISATVSVILRSLEDSDSGVARVVGSLFALGWTVMTFFIVPVIVFEEVSVRSMFSRSASAFRDTWGETIGAGFGITLIVTLVGVVLAIGALAVSIPLTALFPAPGIALTILLLLGVAITTYLLSQTIWGIAKTALYVYAVEGRVPEGFENFDFERLGGRTEEASPGRAGTRDTL